MYNSFILELPVDFFLCKLPCMASQQRNPILHAHPHLLLPNWYHTSRKSSIVLHKQPYCDHKIVNIMEYKSLLRRVKLLIPHKRYRMFAPMPQRVQVVRRMVAIIEAVPVTLVAQADRRKQSVSCVSTRIPLSPRHY